MRLGPREFALYAAAVSMLLVVYILVDQQPPFVAPHDRLSAWRVLTTIVICSVVSGAICYMTTKHMLQCCSQ